MAEKKGRKKKEIPRSAAQKAAERALYAGQQVAVEQTRSRTRQASRGFTGNRQLRAGGTQLQGYDLGRFKNDVPFPGLGGGTYPGGQTAQRPGATRSEATTADGRNRIAQQTKAKSENRRRDNPSGVNNAERMEAQAAAKAAAAEARRKAAAKKEAERRKKSNAGSTRKGSGGVILS